MFFSIFKWVRVTILLILLCLLVTLIFLHQAGLPVSLQEQLVARLRGMGWDVTFSQLRLRWYHGIVAEDLSLSRTHPGGGPTLFVTEAQFELDWTALRSLQFQPDGLRLSQARLLWPMAASPTNVPGRSQGLIIERIHGEVRFHDDDRWELRSLEGHCLGVNLRLRGQLTNALQVREWRLPRPTTPRPPREDQRGWAELLAKVREVRAAVPPELQIQASADGRDPASIAASLKLLAPGLESPWGSTTNLQLDAWLQPAPAPGARPRAGFTLAADATRTAWGDSRQVRLVSDWEPTLEQLLPDEGRLRLELREPAFGPARATQFTAELRKETVEAPAPNVRLSLTAQHPAWGGTTGQHAHLTLRAPVRRAADGPLDLLLESEFTLVSSPWATSSWTRVEGTLRLPHPVTRTLLNPGLAWIDRGAGIEAALACTFSNAIAPHVEPRRLAWTNHWRADGLRVRVEAEAAHARSSADAWLQPTTRALRLNTTMSLQPHAWAGLLPPAVRPWLAAYVSEEPLAVEATASAALPDWGAPSREWRHAIQSTLAVSTRLRAGAGSFRDIPFHQANAMGHYADGHWSVPEFRLQAPGGTLTADARGELASRRFQANLTSALNPAALRAGCPEPFRRQILDLFAFSTPPVVRADVQGTWGDWSRLAATGEGAVTNLAVRGQTFSSASARLAFSNQFLSFIQPVILREGGQRGEAEGVGLDVSSLRLHLTNAQGNLDPVAFTTALGPVVRRALAPYVFDTPPQVRGHGLLPLRPGDHDEDAWFEVVGGPFHWQRFHLDRVRTRIHWLGRAKTVTLTNLTARWCEADAAGWIHLDFSRPRGGTVALAFGVEGANLNAVVRDLQGGVSNRLEGICRGEIQVREAFLDDPASWQGRGQIELREGLLWDLPLFAVVSPMLNRVIPGLGHSRAREGRATCVISNSVVHSTDLEIRASAMQLKYRGTVGFQGEVDATMEAELFRNVPGVGMVLSKVLWPVTKLFEYRVGGTLGQPRLDERYFIPKVLLFPLQPVKTFRDLLEPDPAPAPPAPPNPSRP
ncbi:MAG: hypothetical protein RJA22_1093 [Verrucomicrobiota bacterium]